MRRPGFGCAALVVLLMMLLPASASAANADVFQEGVDTFYKGSDSVDKIAVSVEEPPKWLFQQIADGALMTAGANCTDVEADGKQISCDITDVAKIDLAGADDRLLGGSDDNAMLIDAGAGNDEITICCSAQNIVNGEGGNDEIELGDASNQNSVDGGGGEDLILHPEGPDLINGGADLDTVVYQSTPAETFTVSLDDAPNDGLTGAQNIHSDVENLTGGPERNRFAGSAAANVLKGGQGDDEIDGGPGQDTLEGGEDDDDISARDGEHDMIDCGFGQDSATVDLVDTVVKCELVGYPDLDFDGAGANVDCDDHNAAIRPGATDAPGDGIDQDCAGGDAPPGATGSTPPAISPSGSRKALIRNGVGSAFFTCRAPVGDTCSVKGSLINAAGKAVKIGSVSGKIAGGRTGRLTIRLNRTGRRLLDEHGKLSATIKGTVTDEAGATSKFKTALQLKAPKAKQA
jgi:Ca2+-binding RTX toxin-like protein